MDAGTVRAWAAAAAHALAEARGPIDSLNVFPVPDGDTGTNLALTVAEGAEHVADPGPHAAAAEVAAAFARGALLGARGNSGVIVSQYLHGFAQGLAARRDTDGALVAHALDLAQQAARTAVARPVEGTILTAATAASVEAGAVGRAGGDAAATAAAAVAGAREAMERSPQALAVLRAAGVVDAGASGLVVILEALAAVLGVPAGDGGRGPGAVGGTRGDRAVAASSAPLAVPVPVPVPVPGPGLPAPDAARATHDAADLAHGAHHDDALGDDGEFEVMFVVEPHRPEAAQADVAPALRARMQRLGGSVAVVGGTDGWHVHVHTDHPADAVAAGGEHGAQSQVVVRRLTGPSGAGRSLGVVVGTGAPGLVADLARSGALVMVLTGWPVGARDVLRMVVDTRARRVVVLPGSPSALAAAREAAQRADVPVEVLDAHDDARVVAALTAASLAPTVRTAPAGPEDLLEPSGTGAPAEDPVDVMRRALAAVRTLPVAAPEPDGVLDAARRLLADGGELVTVVSGAALTARVAADRLADLLAEALDPLGAEVVVLAGGQTSPAAVVAVE